MQWPFVKRSTFDEVCEAARDHNLRANTAEGRAERWRAELIQRTKLHKDELRIWVARHDAMLEHLTKIANLQPPAPIFVPKGDIPDPPSVTANDAKVAVAMRDREAPPLKRALRPGEDE